MSFDPISAALDIGGKLIDRLIPDPAAKAAAALELLKLQQTGELAQLTADTDLAKAQDAVNAVEAASPSLLVSGGRPFILWVCGVALANDFIVRPFALFVSTGFHSVALWPALDMQSLMPLLLGMLGLGGLRTFEKINGVAAK